MKKLKLKLKTDEKSEFGRLFYARRAHLRLLGIPMAEIFWSLPIFWNCWEPRTGRWIFFFDFQNFKNFEKKTKNFSQFFRIKILKKNFFFRQNIFSQKFNFSVKILLFFQIFNKNRNLFWVFSQIKISKMFSFFSKFSRKNTFSTNSAWISREKNS